MLLAAAFSNTICYLTVNMYRCVHGIVHGIVCRTLKDMFSHRCGAAKHNLQPDALLKQ